MRRVCDKTDVLFIDLRIPAVNWEEIFIMAEFKAIQTQEEFDVAIQHRLERERAKFSDYEALKVPCNHALSVRIRLILYWRGNL